MAHLLPFDEIQKSCFVSRVLQISQGFFKVPSNYVLASFRIALRKMSTRFSRCLFEVRPCKFYPLSSHSIGRLSFSRRLLKNQSVLVEVVSVKVQFLAINFRTLSQVLQSTVRKLVVKVRFLHSRFYFASQQYFMRHTVCCQRGTVIKIGPSQLFLILNSAQLPALFFGVTLSRNY